jgi:hypothetical protein
MIKHAFEGIGYIGGFSGGNLMVELLAVVGIIAFFVILLLIFTKMYK